MSAPVTDRKSKPQEGVCGESVRHFHRGPVNDPHGPGRVCRAACGVEFTHRGNARFTYPPDACPLCVLADEMGGQ